VREKAEIFAVTDGLSDQDLKVLGYRRADTVQDALDEILRRNPGASIGILPQGGISLPVLEGGGRGE
jgi:hypothetical protein